MKILIQCLICLMLMMVGTTQAAYAGAVPAQTSMHKKSFNKKQLRKQRKALRKKLRTQKPTKTPIGEKIIKGISLGIWLAGIGMFILGLILKIKALWIVGLCIFLAPIVGLIIFGIVFILALAFGNYQLC